MRQIPIASAALLALTLSAAAQTPAPPAPPSGPAEQRADMPVPPPPPGGPRGPRGELEPPRGASVHIDRGPEGAFKVDVRCGERDTTKQCADIATVLLDKLNAEGQRR